MSYIKNNLIDNENVFAEASVHWMVFMPSVLLFIISYFSFSNAAPHQPNAAGPFFLLLAVAFLIDETVKRKTTEMAVTNKRLIAKTGLISRKTIELNLSKVESLAVNQSIFGRILNYGTIEVHGTGGAKSPFKYIKRPLDFRIAVNKQVEAIGK